MYSHTCTTSDQHLQMQKLCVQGIRFKPSAWFMQSEQFSAHFPLASWSWKWLRQHSRNCSANVEQNMLFQGRNRVRIRPRLINTLCSGLWGRDRGDEDSEDCNTDGHHIQASSGLVWSVCIFRLQEFRVQVSSISAEFRV